MVEISREERDAYLIPQNFVDTGTILGGTVKLRNAVEAAVLAVGSAIPLFYLPMAFNIRLMIVIAVSVPLGVFGVVGIGGDSLTQFVAHWFRFMKRRRIVTPTPQGNLEANRHRHLRLISKRYRVVYYDDSNTLPHNAQVLQRKADRHGKLVKPFSEEGVTANLTQWYEQKQGLLQLLRKHPLWNEKELAIVFRVEERREIDRITVDETRAAILELGRRACTDDTVYENFETALRAATADYARIPNEYRLDTIRQYGGIKCAPGQKASRIINRLCLKFHLDQIEEETEAGEPDNRYMRTVRPYNALFARLADALNPAHIEKTAVLSIHPCDFLEMSNRDNTWSSCHCLEGGGYRGGCQSYMGDAVSMIFFTVSDEYTQDFHTAPRITREIFCYKDNVLLQSRLYPTDLEDQKTLYRSIVQQAIATCLDKPNLWSLKRGKDTEPYCESAADSNHYPDYEYGYAVVSLLKGETDYGKMTIGSVARCVCCGGEQKDHRSIRCTECGSMFVCKGCGKTVHGYGRYIDNHFYCKECSYRCTACGEEFIGMPRIGIARSGEQRGISIYCLGDVLHIIKLKSASSCYNSGNGGNYCTNNFGAVFLFRNHFTLFLSS